MHRAPKLPSIAYLSAIGLLLVSELLAFLQGFMQDTSGTMFLTMDVVQRYSFIVSFLGIICGLNLFLFELSSASSSLGESQKRLQEIQKLTRIASFASDATGKIFWWSDNLGLMFGIDVYRQAKWHILGSFVKSRYSVLSGG